MAAFFRVFLVLSDSDDSKHIGLEFPKDNV